MEKNLDTCASSTKPIKWIISDLDGTLLNSQHQISDTTVTRIQQFVESGGVFTFATGRSLTSVRPFMHKLNLTAPVILFNGAKIYDPLQDRFLMEHLLPAETATLALDLYQAVGEQNGLDLLVFHQGHIYVPEITEAALQHGRKDETTIIRQPYEFLYGISGAIDKMILIGPEEKFPLIQQETRLNTVQTEPRYLEIIPPNISKATALTQLIELVQMHPDEFVAVGDNLNDLEMVSMLQHGFAVQNAHPQLKEAAKRITTGTHDQDAMIEIIEFVESENQAILFRA